MECAATSLIALLIMTMALDSYVKILANPSEFGVQLNEQHDREIEYNNNFVCSYCCLLFRRASGHIQT